MAHLPRLVIGAPASRPGLTTILFSETSTIGLRLRREQRLTLPRQAITVATPWGELAAKQITTPTGTIIAPEYEICRAVAEAHGIPLHAVYTAVCRHQLNQTDKES